MGKFRKIMVVLISSAILFGIGAFAVPSPVVGAYAAEEERKTAEIVVRSNYEYFAQGRWVYLWADAYDQNGQSILDNFTWKVEGVTHLWTEDSQREATEADTYFQENENGDDSHCALHIGAEEPIGTEIIVTATSKTSGVFSSYTAAIEDRIPVKLRIGPEPDDDTSPGAEMKIRATFYDQNNSEIWDDNFTWKVEGAFEFKRTDEEEEPKENLTYFSVSEDDSNYIFLHIGTEEQIGKMIKITVTSQKEPSFFGSYIVTVWKREITKIELRCYDDHFVPGHTVDIRAEAYDQIGNYISFIDVEDTLAWKVEGAKNVWTEDLGGEPNEEQTYIRKVIKDNLFAYLHIGTKEPLGTEITVTATVEGKPEIFSSFSTIVDKKETARIELDGYEEEEIDPGYDCEFFVNAYAPDGSLLEYDDIFTWSAEGASEYKWYEDEDGEEGPEEEQTYFMLWEDESKSGINLHIGTTEPNGKKITVTVTSQNNPSLSLSRTITVRRTVTGKVLLECDGRYIEPGSEANIGAITYDQYGEEIEDTFTWKVENVPEWTDEMANLNEEEQMKLTYFRVEDGGQNLILHIGTEESKGKEITVTAISRSNPSISDSRTFTVYVWESVATSINLWYNDRFQYVAPGQGIVVNADVCDQDGGIIKEDTVTWKIEGATNLWNENITASPTREQTYLKEYANRVNLHIGTKEPIGTKITIIATSNSDKNLSASCTINVWEGAWLDVDYHSGSVWLRSSGKDNFLFLEISKKKGDPKGKGTIYCYEGRNVSLNFSFLKLSKDAYIYLYGDKNTEPLQQYTIFAEPKKTSVKFKYDPTKPFAECFTIKGAQLQDFEYRHPNKNSWQPLSSLEEELDKWMVAGTNILVRQMGKDGEKANMPGTEIKIKIPAAPKAPKIKLNYAKNTITLAKNSQVRVPGWNIFSGKQDEIGDYEEVPYYYLVGDKKEDLSPSPERLAEKLVVGYIEAYNKSIDAIKDDWFRVEKLTDEDKEMFLKKLKKGCTLLVRTSDPKKGNSQPAFTEIKAAPVIEIINTDSVIGVVSGSAVRVAVITKEEKGEKTYGDEVKITYDMGKIGKETMKLTASNDNLFAYSLDGKKFTKIKKNGTTVKLDKIKESGIIIRMEGAEDKKNPANSRWASNEVTVPKAKK